MVTHLSARPWYSYSFADAIIHVFSTQTIQCTEGWSTDSSTSAESSSFAVHLAESEPFFNLQAYQPVQCNAMPPMKCTNPMSQVAYVFGQYLVVQWVVTHHSVHLVLAMVLGSLVAASRHVPTVSCT